MKKTLSLAIVMVVALGSSVLAVGFLGTPTAEIGQGNWSIGYDYSYSSQDTEKTRASFSIDGGTPDLFEFKLKDLNVQRHYATIGYGLTPDWDVYVKLGIADVKGQGKDFGTPGDPNDPGSDWGMNFDNKFAWGWGTRYTFARHDNIAWGAALQMNWLDTELTKRDGDSRDKFTFDSYDLLISAGPTVDMGGWKVYGGPFYYYLNGEYKGTYERPGTTANEKADIRADRNWGGFIGSTVDLGHNLNWTIEYSTTGKGWGLGTGIAWSF